MLFKSKSSYKNGLFAEFYARMYLRFRGFRILKTRFVTGKNTGRAEIDIIASRRNLIVFIEVKSRKTIDEALRAISPGQAARLRLSAQNYLAREGWSGDARFDIIAVCGLRIYWIRMAF